jgi:hypothetical protein
MHTFLSIGLVDAERDSRQRLPTDLTKDRQVFGERLVADRKKAEAKIMKDS